MKSLLFAARLSWRQITFERAKLIAAILGVLFACVLVFMQIGFRDSLFDSATSVPRKMQGDLFIVHKQTEAIWRTVSFSRRELYRAFSASDVETVTPMYIGQTPWKNPENRTKRTLMVFGFEPSESVFNIPEIQGYAKALTVQDTVIFDSLSRPEFGNVPALLEKGEVRTEINDRKVDVLGTFRMGASFAADGNLITSDQNFLRMFPFRNIEQIDIGVIKLKQGSDVLSVQNFLKSTLNEDVRIMTLQELIAFEKAYWQNNAPIGFIFGFGMVMGLIVGMVIVYQILFTDITNHLSEFATLRAMGYSLKYLMFIVFSSSLILAVIGFIPGYLLSLGLYTLTESVTFIPMPMGFSKALSVFLMILAMCVTSGILAMRKMKSANPADMFS